MKCRKCGRYLKHPQSIINNMGPVCYKKWLAKLGMKETQPGQLRLDDIEGNDDVILRRTSQGIATNVNHAYVLHSPAGFEWGYGGSGPADLALNILLKYGCDRETAERLHQAFKWETVSKIPKEGGIIYGNFIRMWIETEKAKLIPA
jgi:hypothetical protein